MRIVSKLSDRLYRYPFEGKSARRYRDMERPGFADLDARLIARWDGELRRARTVLDVGSGPGTFARRLASAHRGLAVLTVEPSADFAKAATGTLAIRGRAEALPLATDSVDFVVCLSSMRHVANRRRSLLELRRVVSSDGVVYIVELDPSADADRIRNHTCGMRSLTSRILFGPFVVKTSPSIHAMATVAEAAGWKVDGVDSDPVQPVYMMRLGA